MIRRCCQIVSISRSIFELTRFSRFLVSSLRHCFLIEFKSKSRSIIKEYNAFVHLFRNLHIKHSFHMIFTYLVKIVEQNWRISTLQKRQKSIHDRNNSETWKIISLSKLCLLKCDLTLILKLCTKFFWKNSRTNLFVMTKKIKIAFNEFKIKFTIVFIFTHYNWKTKLRIKIDVFDRETNNVFNQKNKND